LRQCGIQELGEQCGTTITPTTATPATISARASPPRHRVRQHRGHPEIATGSVHHGCSNDACHAPGSSPAISICAPGRAYGQLGASRRQLAEPPKRLRVSGRSDLFLYNKIASKTLGTPNNVGTPMPVGPAIVTEEHLEAIRLWIRGGAPETTVVAGTSELLGSCLPEAQPLKIPQPDAPAAGTGVQFAMPGYDLPQQSETELCVPTFYDLTGQVPAQYVVPCPGAFPGTNPGDQCFAYKRQFLAQDPQSHHSIIHIYKGTYDVTHASWGPWTCYSATTMGKPATRSWRTSDQRRAAVRQRNRGVSGFGAPDQAPQQQRRNSPVGVDLRDHQSDRRLPRCRCAASSVELACLQSASEDMNMEAWLNLDFTDDQQFPAQDSSTRRGSSRRTCCRTKRVSTARRTRSRRARGCSFLTCTAW
jgi:hypothetical protein